MTNRIVGACVLLVWGTSVVSAQEDGPSIGPAGNTAAPRANATSPVGLSNEQLSRRVVALEVQMNALADNLTENITQVFQLKSEVNELRDRLNEEIEKQRQILDAISSIDSSGQRIPRLSAIMRNSPEFKQDLTEAVHNSLQTEGLFEILNKTNAHQRISVNRTEFGVDAGQALVLRVPIGTVTTQLPGKPLENWTVTAPTYAQHIEIVPTENPVTAYRPVTNDTPYGYPAVYYVAP